MKPTRPNDVVAGLVVAFSAVAAGAITGAGSQFLAQAAGWDGINPLAPRPVTFERGAAVIGAALGVVSCVYLVPMLVRTRLRRSLPIVLGTSVAFGVAAGAYNPLVGVAGVLVLQVALSAISSDLFQVVVERARTRCPHCGFDCVSVRDELCPECGFGGPEWCVRNPMLCGVCGKALAVNGECPACGVMDFNAADWREVVRRRAP